MFWTPSPLVNPLPVEIINQTEWWQPYVPPLVGLLGSIIVAAVAFIGVRMSNVTNQKAITSADERERDRWKTDSDREREKWHRDNLLRICSEALRISRDIIHQYNEAVDVALNSEDADGLRQVFWNHMNAADGAIDKVAPLSYDLLLLGEKELYMKFQEVRQVGEYVRPAFVGYYLYLNRQREDNAPTFPTREAMLAAHYASIEYRRYSKAMHHLTNTFGDFQRAAQQKISPHSLPEGDLPKPMDIERDFSLPPMGDIYRNPSPYDWDAGDTAEPEPKD